MFFWENPALFMNLAGNLWVSSEKNHPNPRKSAAFWPRLMAQSAELYCYAFILALFPKRLVCVIMNYIRGEV
jgi:hypothetical protein